MKPEFVVIAISCVLGRNFDDQLQSFKVVIYVK